MKTLKDIRIGHTAKVIKVHGEGPVRRRIMDMGITRGVLVRVRKVAPLGDPIEVTVRGYELSLRKADADMIEVEVAKKSTIADCSKETSILTILNEKITDSWIIVTSPS